MKFALISNVLPPSESAHAMIIHRLLRELDPESYCLLSSKDYTAPDEVNYSARLPGRHYYLPPTFQLTRGYRFGLGFWRERINFVMGVVLRARHIARILRSEKCEAVVVCTGGNEILDFPAGYLASRLTGGSFYAYLLDQYSHMVSYVLGTSLLRRLEPVIMKGAATVIAPNEFLCDEVRRRFQIEPVVIHNMCDLSVYENAPVKAAKIDRAAVRDDEIKIVYTGAIGCLHFDAFRNLIAAVESLDQRKVRLHLYSSQPVSAFEAEGIVGPVVYHQYEPVFAMPAIQQGADVLFLPLAFNSPYPDIVRTAAPGKMGEFLAARRPILVHAPADSFIAWYFRHYECGLVVDQDDPAQLARALELLLSDSDLCEQLSAHARERAEADFSLPKARAQFTQLMGLEVSGETSTNHVAPHTREASAVGVASRASDG